MMIWRRLATVATGYLRLYDVTKTSKEDVSCMGLVVGVAGLCFGRFIELINVKPFYYLDR